MFKSVYSHSVPLLDFWNELATHRAGDVALWHPRAPEGLRFGQIDRRSRELSVDGTHGIACGESLDFFPSIIAAWRARKPVVLVETEKCQVRPIRGAIPPDILLIKQTCGVSGVERSLFFTADQLMAEAQSNIDGLGLHGERRGLAAISLAHSFGFGCLALPLLVGGIPLEIVPAPMPMFMYGALAKGGPLFLPGVPAMWKTWWLTGLAADRAIDLAVSAGSPLSLELERGIHSECGLRVRNFYGTSETGAISLDRSKALRISAECVGTPLPGVDVTSDENGRILVSTLARAHGADLVFAEDEFGDGSYRTHDIGEIRDGEIFIQHCDGGAINVAGRKVSPAKLCSILEGIDGVLTAEVTCGTSRDFERFNEIRVHVCVTQHADPKQVREQFRQQIESWEMPRKWKFDMITRH